MAGRLILDAGGLIAAGRRDRFIQELVEEFRSSRGLVIIPAVVLAQTLRGTGRDAPINRLIRVCTVTGLDVALARAAGRLLAQTGLTDAVDALVAAEALRNTPCVLATSDPDDMGRLVGGAGDVRILPV